METMTTKRDERNTAHDCYHRIWNLKELREIAVVIKHPTRMIDRQITSNLDTIAFLRETRPAA